MSFPPVIRGSFYALCIVILFFWIFTGLVSLDRALGVVLPRVFKFVGIPILIGGAIVFFNCAILLINRGRGTPAPLIHRVNLSFLDLTGTYGIQ